MELAGSPRRDAGFTRITRSTTSAVRSAARSASSPPMDSPSSTSRRPGSSSARRRSWGGVAATADTEYTDGRSHTFAFLERPQLVFDESGVRPVALTNGVLSGTTRPRFAGTDRSFTLLRPLRQERAV